jgi:hypothetical protein
MQCEEEATEAMEMEAGGEVESQAEQAKSGGDAKSAPVCVIVVGMAGSGKTTFLQRLTSHVYAKQMEERAKVLDAFLSQGEGADESAPSGSDGPTVPEVEGEAKEKELPQKREFYVVNLDPAVMHVPFPTNIDIRDNVNYKDVMKEYVASTPVAATPSTIGSLDVADTPWARTARL